MNVAFVSLFGPGKNGVGNTAFNQARMMARRGHTVLLVTAGDAPASENLTVQKIEPVRSFQGLKWSAALRLPAFSRAKGLTLFGRLAELGQGITSLNVDIIRFAGAVGKHLPALCVRENVGAVFFTESFVEAAYWRAPPPSLGAGTAGCVTLMRFACPRYLFQRVGLSDAPVNRKLDRLDRNAVGRADVYYTPSEKMRALAADYYGIPASGIRVVPNPVDTETFKPAEEEGDVPRVFRPVFRNNIKVHCSKEQWHIEKPVILFVGRFSREKGAGLLMEIIPGLLEEFPGLEFTIAGSSDVDENNVPLARLLAEKSKGRVTWLGSIPYGELPDLYRRSSVLVLPTLFDNFPLTVVEAMSSGLPVVVSDAAGIAETVRKSGGGVVVPASDCGGTREALVRLLSKKDERVSLGRDARKYAEEHFSFSAVTPLLESLLK